MEHISRGERAPSNNRAEVVEYLKQKLEDAEKKFDAFNSDLHHYKDINLPPIPPPIPREAIGDGGSDIQDWKVETGVSKYEAELKDYFASDDALEKLAHLKDSIEELKIDIEAIEKGVENDLTFERLWNELKSAK